MNLLGCCFCRLLQHAPEGALDSLNDPINWFVNLFICYGGSGCFSALFECTSICINELLAIKLFAEVSLAGALITLMFQECKDSCFFFYAWEKQKKSHVVDASTRR